MRKVICQMCLVAMLMGCDKQPDPDPAGQPGAAKTLQLKAVSASELDALTGHWIHNPRWCKQQFVLDQAFDLVIEQQGIRLGGANRPIPGILSASSATLDTAQAWPGCQPRSPAMAPEPLKGFTFTSPNLTLTFYLGETFLLMEDAGGTVYELKHADSLAQSHFDLIISQTDTQRGEKR